LRGRDTLLPHKHQIGRQLEEEALFLQQTNMEERGRTLFSSLFLPNVAKQTDPKSRIEKLELVVSDTGSCSAPFLIT